MKLRQFLLISVGIVAAIAAKASEPSDSTSIVAAINAGGNVTVVVPDALLPRLSAAPSTSATKDAQSSTQNSTSRVGYRVQVFDDNSVGTAKHKAESRKAMMESRFPEYRVYLQFNSPYWRVKVGDFSTRSEAQAAMDAIRQAFPSFGPQLRVVRDRINRN